MLDIFIHTKIFVTFLKFLCLLSHFCLYYYYFLKYVPYIDFILPGSAETMSLFVNIGITSLLKKCNSIIKLDYITYNYVSRALESGQVCASLLQSFLSNLVYLHFNHVAGAFKQSNQQ